MIDFTLIAVLALEIHYQLELNWKVCLLPDWRKLAKSSTYKEPHWVWMVHDVKAGMWYLYMKNSPDLDPSPTVMHQKFFEDKYLPILSNTYGGNHGYIGVGNRKEFTVTANVPAYPDRILMRIKGVHDLNRSHVFTMQLNHTGDGTSVSLKSSKYLYCTGPSCGRNGLNKHGVNGPPVILQEIYFNQWSTTDTVEPIIVYEVKSYVTSCNRVGKS